MKPKQKIAIMMGRSIEGCGVTRYALEMQAWYKANGYQCDIYASSDKQWGRKDAQENEIIEFDNDEVETLAKKIDSTYDVVYYQSLPSKSHSEEYQQAFFEHMVQGIKNPVKLAFQNDHKLQSLSRNYKIWETMAEMDGAYTHALTSFFAKKMKELNPKVELIKMGVGFDFESLKQYWKPIDSQIRRVSYFGRFAGFKDPQRMITLQPFLQEVNIISEMRGIERSIGSLALFYNDLSDRKNSYKTNIYEVKKKDKDLVQTPEKVWIYGPYNRLEGVEELSKSMFGADFYNLEPELYGDNTEYAMCEIIAAGCVPVFDIHWAKHCKHEDGRMFDTISNFAIYSDGSSETGLRQTAQQLNELANDHKKREQRRLDCFEIAKSHCDSDTVYRQVHSNAVRLLESKRVAI